MSKYIWWLYHLSCVLPSKFVKSLHSHLLFLFIWYILQSSLFSDSTLVYNVGGKQCVEASIKTLFFFQIWEEISRRLPTLSSWRWASRVSWSVTLPGANLSPRSWAGWGTGWSWTPRRTPTSSSAAPATCWSCRPSWLTLPTTVAWLAMLPSRGSPVQLSSLSTVSWNIFTTHAVQANVRFYDLKASAVLHTQ